MSTPVNVYTLGTGTASTAGLGLTPLILETAPTSSLVRGPSGPLVVGQQAVVPSTNAVYELTSFSSAGGIVTATWTSLGSAGGGVDSISGNTGTATPTAGNIAFSGGSTGLSFAASGSTVTLTGSVGSLTFDADSGSATPSGGVITFAGGTGISTSGSGSTITITNTSSAGVTSVTGTADQILASPTTGAVILSLIGPYTPSTYTANGVLFGNATSSIQATASVNDGVLITSNTGVPSLLANGTTGQVLTATTGSPPSWTTLAASGVTSVTGTANQILASPTTGAVILSLIGPYTPATYTTNGLLFGNSTSSIQATAAVNDGVLITSNTGVPSLLANGTTGQVLTATTGSPPSWTTIASGVSSVTGTANQVLATPTTGAVVVSLIGPYTPSTYTANGILFGNTTSSIQATAAVNDGVLITSNTGVPSLLANGTTGQVLTATTGSPPSWTTVSSGIVTIDGDTGSITGATVTVYADKTANNAGAFVGFTNSGTTSTFNLSGGSPSLNTFLGRTCGTTGGGNTDCTAVGVLSCGDLTSGTSITAVGHESLGAAVDIANTCAFGYECLSTVNVGGGNSGFGTNALLNLATGSNNTAIGFNAGTAYTAAESGNIVIGEAVLGTAGESNKTRIGVQGTQTGTFIAGINGATPVTGNTPQVVLADNTGNLATISSSTAGFVLTSNGTATPSFQAVSSGALTWNNVTTTSASMVANNGYLANNAGLVTLTLPTTAAQFTLIEVVGFGAGGWTIVQNAGQTIHFGNATTTAGSGSISSTNQYDAIYLICATANTVWVAQNSIGNLTVV